jgi:type III secretory pathway component EscV
LREVRERLALETGDRSSLALLVESAAVRPFVRKLIELEWPDVPVLSRRELIRGVAVANETQTREAIRDASG